MKFKITTREGKVIYKESGDEGLLNYAQDYYVTIEDRKPTRGERHE